MLISRLHGRQIFDSRGNPTVECVLSLSDGFEVVASVPAGASVGAHEAKALYDGDQHHFAGKGVYKAVELINTTLAKLIVGRVPNVQAIDHSLITLDGTPNKAHLGANTLLAVSIAVTRAAAHSADLELFEFINQAWGFKKRGLPRCMFNIINGGAHAHNGLAFQEFMIVPSALTIAGTLEAAQAVYHQLKTLLEAAGLATGLGDEGGFAPVVLGQGIAMEHAALGFVQQAVSAAGLQGSVGYALDVAASQFYNAARGNYALHGAALTADDMIALYEKLLATHDIISIEDGLAEDDWAGWQQMTQRLGNRVQLVGDDLFTTNTERITHGAALGAANAVLIKPNQIGTVTETINAVQYAQQKGYAIVVSHRSGETNDAFIADLAVGVGADFLKAGAPARGERIAKYNRLLEIEELLI
jgi:enolase